MSKTTKLTKRQRAVLEDLFLGELDEQEALDKHKVSRALYERWLADERFATEFEERIVHSYRQSRVILARYAPLAAAKLVGLTRRAAPMPNRLRRQSRSLTRPHRSYPPRPPAASSPPSPRSRARGRSHRSDCIKDRLEGLWNGGFEGEVVVRG